MKCISRMMVISLLVGCTYLVGCDGNGTGSFQSFLSQLSGSSLNGRDSGDDSSVADVTDGQNNQSSNSIFAEGASRARVRNESDRRADITLNFYSDDSIVHSAFIQIHPDMVTTVASLRKVDSVELSGEDVTGRILNGRTYFFGVDFDAFIPAEYVIRSDGRVELVPSHPGPSTSRPTPTLEIDKPSENQTLFIGSTVEVSWTDDNWDANALIQIYLQPVGSTSVSSLIPIGSPIRTSLDGDNDKRQIVLENAVLGFYHVVIQANQDNRTVTAVSRGIIRLIDDPMNVAPELEILSPKKNDRVELHIGDTLDVTWEDLDDDDNATITFELESVAQAGMTTGKFIISNPFAEDPDGDVSDSASLKIENVLPGIYHLVGTIDDGKLTGTSRIENAVLVLPEPVVNDPPTFEFIQPRNNIEVIFDESFTISWVDSDENDNARISIMLDPDLGNTQISGNEIVLKDSIEEDADGENDQLTLDLPDGIKKQSYRLLGVIFDGQTEVVTPAPGRIVVIDRVDSNPGGNNPGGNDDGGSGGDDTLPDLPIVNGDDSDSLTRMRLTEYPVQITYLEVSSPGRVTISNVLSGGSLEIDLSSDQWNISQESGLMLTIPDNLVSADVTPRIFDVILEYMSDNNRRTIISDSPINIQ